MLTATAYPAYQRATQDKISFRLPLSLASPAPTQAIASESCWASAIAWRVQYTERRYVRMRLQLASAELSGRLARQFFWAYGLTKRSTFARLRIHLARTVQYDYDFGQQLWFATLMLCTLSRLRSLNLGFLFSLLCSNRPAPCVAKRRGKTRLNSEFRQMARPAEL